MARTGFYGGAKLVPLRDLPGAALRAVLREGYGRAELRRDVMAGLVVGVVALPLSMALAIAVGVPPQHGLYTAIVAGLLVAGLGGSRTQVSGPTAAFIVILAPIEARFGLAGLLVAGGMAGLMLIVMAVLRLGRLIEFIPHPVTTGFTTGIALVIATLQWKDLLGLQLASTPEHFFERIAAMAAAAPTARFAELGIGLLTMAVLIGLPARTRRVPPALIALPLAAIVAALVMHFFPAVPITTVAARFTTEIDGHMVTGIPALPPSPIWPWYAGGATASIDFAMLRALVPSAFAIAMLGAIESLLSAVVSDGMVQTRHDPDAELLALGIANVVCPFFGGIAATGAIARTATNIRNGGRSPVAAMTHAVVVLLAVIFLAPLIGHIPMASLAALLLLVAWNMSEVQHFVYIIKVAPRPDIMVLLACFALTVVFDMVVAVSAGVMLAALLSMRRMVDLTSATMSDESAEPPPEEGAADANAVPYLPRSIVVYDISGPLFFGAAQKAMSALGQVRRGAQVVIFRLEKVPAMDATGLVALESAVESLRKQDLFAVLCGPQEQPASLIRNAHMVEDASRCIILGTFEEARDFALARAKAAIPPPLPHA